MSNEGGGAACGGRVSMHEAHEKAPRVPARVQQQGHLVLPLQPPPPCMGHYASHHSSGLHSASCDHHDDTHVAVLDGAVVRRKARTARAVLVHAVLSCMLWGVARERDA